MHLPINTFKQRLHADERQIGLWLGLASPYTAEMAATAGYDWLLLDGEHSPNDLATLLVQVETVAGLENLDAIVVTPGVEGVFIGPADLSATLGHRGNPGHPAVCQAINDAISRVRSVGKAVGIVTTDEDEARGYLAAGCSFVGGIDTLLLMNAMHGLAGRLRDER